MITKENPSMNSAAESIYIYNSDEQVRELCRRREDAIAHEKFQNEKIEELTSTVYDLTSKLEEVSNKNQKSFEQGKIIARYEDGMSISEIAQKSNITVEVVKNILKENGML